jgi:signal peptidase I
MNEQRSPDPDSIPGIAEEQESRPARTAGPNDKTHVAAAAVTQRLVRELASWAGTLMSAGVYATVIITFVFQVARVEGHSMEPTLADKDRLVINKLTYRLGVPNIGDVVMMYYPPDPTKMLVKRVVASEGDRVQIVDGKIYRNGELTDDSFVEPIFRSHDDWGPQVIPAGYYFVLGDHRNASSDSRSWGYVPRNYITGKVQVRWWPPVHACVFSHHRSTFGCGAN